MGHPISVTRFDVWATRPSLFRWDNYGEMELGLLGRFCADADDDGGVSIQFLIEMRHPIQ
jgi:hypothetical protein